MGVVRYASLGHSIAGALGAAGAPEIRIGHARNCITFRQLGASRWPESKQADHALHVAAVARQILAADSRKDVRDRAKRAVVVTYIDSAIVSGCAVERRSEFVVPA